MLRGKKATAKIQTAMPQTVNVTTTVNDFFLYALFARLTFSDNDKVEFQTKYDKSTDSIELQIPDKYLPVFDQMTGIGQGPRFKQFVNWLVGGLQSQIDDLNDEIDNININGALRFDQRQVLDLTELRQVKTNLSIGSQPTITYDISGNVSNIAYVDGSQKQFTYNLDGSLSRIDHVFVSPAYTYRKDFTYSAGSLINITESIL